MATEVSGQVSARERFAERVRGAHLLEYWDAGYRKPYPDTGAVAHLWRWSELKELLGQTTSLIDMSEAERRGLILANPGLSQPYLTPTLFADVQLLMPQERAPAHRHTSSASRLFMEGTGGYTVVEGEKCYMGEGDLIINPSWQWHDHGNEGEENIVYLNVLDVPLVETLGCIFYDHDYKREDPAGQDYQSPTKPLDTSDRLFRRSGLFPRAFRNSTQHEASPQLVYRWEHAREGLEQLRSFSPDPNDAHVLEYVNPATGGPVQQTMSFNVQLLPPSYAAEGHRHTSSGVYWVIDGKGELELADRTIEWSKNDIFILPSWAWHRLRNISDSTDAFLMSVTDEPAIRALGLYREQAGDLTA